MIIQDTGLAVVIFASYSHYSVSFLLLPQKKNKICTNLWLFVSFFLFLACALSHKEDGNYNFEKKKYKLAIAAYSEGLNQKHEDNTLSAVLYTNRAAAQFYLGTLFRFIVFSL